MAKLSAYGQRELHRVYKEWTFTREENGLTSWEREEVALMDNRRILRRLVVRFWDMGRHDYGWKVEPRKVKEGRIEHYFKRLLETGWTEVVK